MDSKICVGIPSYIPDGPGRQHRLEKVKATLANIDKNLNIPIIIIAQNGKGEIDIQPNGIVFYYDKLGITGARVKLREKFLASNFDYLIMMDDEIEFKIKNKARFLDTIIGHTEGGTLLGDNIQFAVISKNLYKQVEFPDVDVNRDKIFEDAVFVALLKALFGDKGYKIDTSYVEYDTYKNCTAYDKDASTWWDGHGATIMQCKINTMNYIIKNITPLEKNKSTSNSDGFGNFGL